MDFRNQTAFGRGLVSFASTLWDRWLGGRPVISIDAQQQRLSLSVRNLAAAGIFIEDIEIHPAHLRVWIRDDLKAVVQPSAGHSSKAYLAPGQEQLYPLILSQRRDDPRDAVRIKVIWRSADELQRRRFPATLKVSVAALKAIRNG